MEPTEPTEPTEPPGHRAWCPETVVPMVPTQRTGQPTTQPPPPRLWALTPQVPLGDPGRHPVCRGLTARPGFFCFQIPAAGSPAQGSPQLRGLPSPGAPRLGLSLPIPWPFRSSAPESAQSLWPLQPLGVWGPWLPQEGLCRARGRARLPIGVCRSVLWAPGLTRPVPGPARGLQVLERKSTTWPRAQVGNPAWTVFPGGCGTPHSRTSGGQAAVTSRAGQRRMGMG